MFERFNEAARRALFFARYEATELGSTSIESEHVLLGLTREPQGAIKALLAMSDAPMDVLREEIKAECHGGEKSSTRVEIPFTSDVQSVLRFTFDEANRLRHGYIGPEHMLLGVMRVEGCSAEKILSRHNLRVDAVRDELVRLFKGPLAGMSPDIEVLNQIDRIKALVAQLPGVASDPPAVLQLAQAITIELDALVGGSPPSE
jgi:ATP-dependent Clp protease ATP-binding subunit ClpC